MLLKIKKNQEKIKKNEILSIDQGKYMKFRMKNL